MTYYRLNIPLVVVSCIKDRSKVKTMTAGGYKLNYSLAGEGDIIILLPPPLSDHRVYCSLNKSLSKQYKVVSLDLPNTSSLDQAIHVLSEAINIGTKTNFHLIASSATGWIAQYLAHKLKSKIKSLILINSFYHNQTYGNTYKIALKSTKLLPSFKFKKEVIKRSKFLFKGIQDQSVLNKYIEQRVNSLDKSGIRKQMSWFVENRNQPKPLKLPILHIYSSNDPILEKSDQVAIEQNHNDVVSKEIKTNSHLLALSHEEEITRMVPSFLHNMNN